MHRELARPLEDLTQEYLTSKDLYTGRWHGFYTEVVIDRATGTVESTLVEID